MAWWTVIPYGVDSCLTLRDMLYAFVLTDAFADICDSQRNIVGCVFRTRQDISIQLSAHSWFCRSRTCQSHVPA